MAKKERTMSSVCPRNIQKGFGIKTCLEFGELCGKEIEDDDVLCVDTETFEEIKVDEWQLLFEHWGSLPRI